MDKKGLNICNTGNSIMTKVVRMLVINSSMLSKPLWNHPLTSSQGKQDQSVRDCSCFALSLQLLYTAFGFSSCAGRRLKCLKKKSQTSQPCLLVNVLAVKVAAQAGCIPFAPNWQPLQQPAWMAVLLCFACVTQSGPAGSTRKCSH